MSSKYTKILTFAAILRAGCFNPEEWKNCIPKTMKDARCPFDIIPYRALYNLRHKVIPDMMIELKRNEFLGRMRRHFPYESYHIDECMANVDLLEDEASKNSWSEDKKNLHKREIYSVYILRILVRLLETFPPALLRKEERKGVMPISKSALSSSIDMEGDQLKILNEPIPDSMLEFTSNFIEDKAFLSEWLKHSKLSIYYWTMLIYIDMKDYELPIRDMPPFMQKAWKDAKKDLEPKPLHDLTHFFIILFPEEREAYLKGKLMEYFNQIQLPAKYHRMSFNMSVLPIIISKLSKQAINQIPPAFTIILHKVASFLI